MKNKKIKFISVKEAVPKEYGAYLVYAPDYHPGTSSGLDNIKGFMFARWLPNKKLKNNGYWSVEVGYYNRPNCVKAWLPISELFGLLDVNNIVYQDRNTLKS